MGCCFSRSPSDPGEAIRISHIHGNQTSMEQEQQQPRVEHTLPLRDRFNLPLHRHIWVSKVPLTAGQLRLRREEYFDTRVTGRMEIWNAIRMAVDVLDEDLETAQQILNAAGISIPTGDLRNGVFDELGNRYDLPEYCVSIPMNLLQTPDGGDDIEEKGAETDNEETDIRREEKGKMPIHLQENIYSVTARLSDRGGPDIMVRFAKSDHVRVIARRILENAGIPPDQFKIRIAYLGKILKDTETLHENHWVDGHLVNALVFPRTRF
ncbi:unnamed protein product [Tuber melanosporum]|uniref:(Perigord truffle) hypothetical protein n=1 Tax=Tuber melanosporum (strain Mel28) TaxID=656061 RepID=D5GC93_TUBMM|nr:uncharacterized protein GSTUM_00000582001 [Tuber melanosporum]CAZ82136.1 unnamed protein product [Tuber melanosporum]